MSSPAVAVRACPTPSRERRLAVACAGAGLAPFVVGHFAFGVSHGHVDDAGSWCGFRELTGLPCPLCGATRAIVLASHADGGFLQFNAVWVGVALALIALGAVGLVGSARGRCPLQRMRTRVAAGLAGKRLLTWCLIVAAVAVPWSWALMHIGTIAPA